MKINSIKASLILGLFISINANAGTFDIFHPIQSAKKAIVVGAVGYVAIKGTADYLLKHPDKVENFLSTHPEQIEPLNQYVDKKIAGAKNQAEYDKYLNFKEQLSLGISESQALVLENDVEWQAIKLEVDRAVTTTDAILNENNLMPKNCSIAVVQTLLMKTELFENDVNQVLPKIHSSPTNILDVNTYSALVKKYQNKNIPQQQDHIPSYAALVKFFNNHHVQIKPSIGSKRNKDLANNATSIAIPEDIHRLGRTYGGKNRSEQVDGDAKNLFFATIKDITTTAYAFYKNPQYNISYKDYIEASMTVFARNRMLCLYNL